MPAGRFAGFFAGLLVNPVSVFYRGGPVELCTDSVEKPVYKAVQSVYSCKVGRRCLFFRQWRPGSGQRDNVTGWRESLRKRFGFSAAGAHPARGRPPRQSFHRCRQRGGRKRRSPLIPVPERLSGSFISFSSRVHHKAVAGHNGQRPACVLFFPDAIPGHVPERFDETHPLAEGCPFFCRCRLVWLLLGGKTGRNRWKRRPGKRENGRFCPGGFFCRTLFPIGRPGQNRPACRGFSAVGRYRTGRHVTRQTG